MADFAIIPQHLSIDSMRSSGYKDSAYAVAELIDNSIQAGEGLDRPITVELICVDKSGHETGGRRRINRVAVYDNAAGMTPEQLRSALQFGVGSHKDAANQKGIGKFGMGLPNSSISQCRRVDVYSWQEGTTYHTYLDIDEVEAQTLVEIPDPSPATIPSEWVELISDKIGSSGTLVVWSTLDLMKWKQSSALLRNTEFIIGRVHRYFLADGRASIRLASYEHSAGKYRSDTDRLLRPNDPMFLMKGTLSPKPYDDAPAFELFGEEDLTVGFGGAEHTIRIRASICKPEVRKLGGAAPIGQVAKKNLGVSVVRAERELEMNMTFENTYDPRERWWGIEVNFQPALDDLFGVTNNKQSATGFHRMVIEEDAAAEGMSLVDFRQMLELDKDPRLVMYQVSQVIDKLLSVMRAQIRRLKEGERTDRERTSNDVSAESIATRALRRRQEKLGNKGASDEGEKQPEEQRTQTLTSEIEQEGVDRERAKAIAVDYVKRNIKFLFRHADFPGAAVFDVTSKAGVIIVTINTRHPAHEHLFELLRDEQSESPESPALQGLKLLLTAWARMEDEAGGDQKTALEDFRGEWGRIARDFIKEAEE
ncbi:hypothetical protein ASG47_19975 [Devosia sp. Leaf420]|uniref:ATP-binding protein n=1 Tax=Devosia sp. Leaf420 TaxID=1736374 RepID=UPI000714D8DD|nr:ATP-binding protein [Devosia sp. Leaf420]KQT50208.1 hypothetical protein ASG47_19975 [Devosia sp. Leaf420]